jgi:hypothetical protein
VGEGLEGEVKMGREWMRRGRKSSWEGEQWIVLQERGRNEGGKNRDKKIVMIKLIIKNRYSEKIQWLGESSGVIPLVSNPGIGA